MLARDFMLRLEPKPLPNPTYDVVTHVSDPGGYKIKTETVPNRVKFFFEHNTEQITEEMWCKLLSFWREIQNGGESLLDANPSENGTFYRMEAFKGFSSEVDETSYYWISIHLTSFEFDEQHRDLLYLTERKGGEFYHPTSALRYPEQAKRKIEYYEEDGSFRNVMIFQWQFKFIEQDECNKAMDELESYLS